MSSQSVKGVGGGQPEFLGFFHGRETGDGAGSAGLMPAARVSAASTSEVGGVVVVMVRGCKGAGESGRESIPEKVDGPIEFSLQGHDACFIHRCRTVGVARACFLSLSLSLSLWIQGGHPLLYRSSLC